MLLVWPIEQESSLWLEFNPEFEIALEFKFGIPKFIFASLGLILFLGILFNGYLFWVP